MKREMMSLLTYSSSRTLANSPSFEAAARRTMGVSSEHKLRKCLEVGGLEWNGVKSLKHTTNFMIFFINTIIMIIN